MIQLNLNVEEAAMLTEVLQSYLSDLRMEIADTEAMELRERLKLQEVFIKKLLQELSREQA